MLGWFRQHATILMVVLGSAAMVIFGLGPVFDRISQGGLGGGGYENRTLANWKGGSLTENELAIMQRRHYEVGRFLTEVTKQAAAKLDTFRPLAPMVPPLRNNDLNGDIMNRLMFAEKAKQEGFVASDSMVESYISMLSADAGFSENDLLEMNRRANGDTPFLVVKEHLKTELLYLQMLSYLYDNNQMPTPNVTEGMQLYFRTNEQIECQILPLEVSEFISKVTSDPTSAEIKRIYEEGKSEFSDPLNETPGFKVPNKANIRYFIADYESFLQNEMNELTDEEVQKKYEQLVAEKNLIVMEPMASDNSFEINTPPPTAPDQTPGEGADESDLPSEPPAGETEKSDAPTDVEAPPAELEMNDPQAPENSESNGEAKATDPNAGESTQPKPDAQSGGDEKAPEPNQNSAESGKQPSPPDSPESDEPKQGDGSASGEEDDQSRRWNQPLWIFAAMLGQNANQSIVAFGEQEEQESELPKTDDQESNSQDAEPQGSQENAGASSDSEPVAPQTPDESGSGDDQSQSPEQPPGPPADLGGLLESLNVQDPPPTQQPEQRAKPLKEVVVQVKRLMAQESARETMIEAITEASSEVRTFYAVQKEWEMNREGAPPEPIDFEEIADRFNLKARETGLVGPAEFADEELGAIPGMNVPLEVFSKFNRIELFEPQMLESTNFQIRSIYSYWFIEKQESRIPTLSECRDQVIEYWKQQEAQKLAMAEAKSIAEKINSATDKHLKDLYPDTALETGAFTWFNTQFQGISQPLGVQNAGDDFMQVAFGLKEGEAGTASNITRDRIYVIENLTGTRPIEEVGREYLEKQFGPFRGSTPTIRTAAGFYKSQINQETTKTLRDDLGFEAAN